MSDFWEDVLALRMIDADGEREVRVGDEVRLHGDGEERPVQGMLMALKDHEATVATFAGRSVVLKFKNRPEPVPE